jgi:Transposase, Mutator family
MPFSISRSRAGACATSRAHAWQTYFFWATGHDHLELRRHNVEPFETSFEAAAARARPRRRIDHALARQGLSQWPARRPVPLERGHRDIQTSDGAPGIIKAIEAGYPRAARQRCVAHRMRNLAAKVPEDVWPDFKVRAQASDQAPSRAIGRELAGGVVADYGRKYGSGRVLPWLHGRLRSLHRPPAIPGDASAAHMDDELA